VTRRNAVGLADLLAGPDLAAELALHVAIARRGLRDTRLVRHLRGERPFDAVVGLCRAQGQNGQWGVADRATGADLHRAGDLVVVHLEFRGIAGAR
jgi:hypothetical protein